MSEGVHLFNPLPTVLAHYEREMRETLDRIGIPTHRIAPDPAMDDKGTPKPRRLVEHLRAVRAARSSDRPLVVLWPGVGWLETALWARRRAPTYLVIHDPVAIRRQYGHAAPLRAIAQAAAVRRGPILVCHTPDAAVATRDALDLPSVPPVALHPISNAAQVERRPGSGRRTVLVAGEYKPTRDLGLLGRLAPVLRDMGMTPRIIGRGWPAVDGWEVTAEFVSEATLSSAIADASAVVVPYARYWQSGIAIQAVEVGVPVVGLRTQFLELLLGSSSTGLVEESGSDDMWAAALRSAVVSERARDRADTYRQVVDTSWRALLSDTRTDSPGGLAR